MASSGWAFAQNQVTVPDLIMLRQTKSRFDARSRGGFQSVAPPCRGSNNNKDDRRSDFQWSVDSLRAATSKGDRDRTQDRLSHDTFISSSSNMSQHEDSDDIDTPNFDDDGEGYLPPEEHVVALHDFSSNNETCLSFKTGQVIKVFTRDGSGWWDGELDGKRGWFPSNYVDENGMSVGSPFRTNKALPTIRTDADDERYDRLRDTSVLSNSSAARATGPFDGPGGIVDPILHAISLLHNAVRAGRVAHFQPSTSCVISSVRSVLSATDCLTRESPMLKAHPVLARERKQILSELSRLVTQARKASGPMDNPTLREAEMLAMISMADQVLKNVRRFLEVAVECGVNVPNRRSSVYDDVLSHDDPSRPRAMPNRNEEDKTPTPDSPRSSSYLTAYSAPLSTRSGKLGGYYGSGYDDDEDEDDGKPLPRLLKLPTNSNRSKGPRLEAGRQRSGSTSESLEEDSGSGSGSGSGSSESIAEPTTPGRVMRTPQEILQRIVPANDQLLSIIAAFIGHVHTHTRESHASSHAHLIEMTRKAVDSVRCLLAIIEAVIGSPGLQTQLPNEMAILWDARESLYEATSALVTAARIITSPSHGPTTASTEDEEKSRLLNSATTVIRTASECVAAVQLGISRSIGPLMIALQEPSKTYGADDTNHDLDDEDDDAADTALRRAKHTLSFLGRKATSLSCLRDKYDHETTSVEVPGQINEDGPLRDAHEEDDVSSEENETAAVHSARPELVRSNSVASRPSMSDNRSLSTPKPLQGRARASTTAAAAQRPTLGSLGSSSPMMEIPGGHSSDEISEPMSREHSRASNSTAYSVRSNASTGETSTRASLEASASGESRWTDGSQPAPLSKVPSREQPEPKALAAVTSSSEFRKASISAESTRSGSSGVGGRSRSGTLDDRTIVATTPLEALYMAPDFDPSDVAYNLQGQVTGATLPALVEKMTPHDTTIDATFSNAFFLCFRLFAAPKDLFEALVARYHIQPPTGVEMSEEELKRWQEVKMTPVRLRVFNFFKAWLEVHWNPSTDSIILDKLLEFQRSSMDSGALQRASQRLGELAQKRVICGPQKKTMMVGNHRGPGSLKRVLSSDRLKNGALPPSLTDSANMYAASSFSRGGPSPPAPIITKTALASLRSPTFAQVSVLELDPLELARQFTVMESKLYCAILPEELLGQEFSKKAGVSSAVHVKKMSALSTHITGWISECILGESDARKRTQLVKFFVKLGDRCFGLNNFNTLMAIQCALNSSTIARLKKTWDGLPTKYRGMMDQQRRAIEHTRNFADYRARLRDTFPPALPFVGLFLTDLTFCHEGNAPTRPSPNDPSKRLLNFDKYVKMSRIIGDLQRFQVPYCLLEVPEIQTYLESVLAGVGDQGRSMGADDLYRRSLLLEPRHDASGNSGTISGRVGADGTTLGKLDLFNWKA